MIESDSSIVCEHGCQKRKCEICERDEEISELRAEVARMREEFLWQECFFREYHEKTFSPHPGQNDYWSNRWSEFRDRINKAIADSEESACAITIWTVQERGPGVQSVVRNIQ